MMTTKPAQRWSKVLRVKYSHLIQSFIKHTQDSTNSPRSCLYNLTKHTSISSE